MPGQTEIDPQIDAFCKSITYFPFFLKISETPLLYLTSKKQILKT